MFEYFGKNCGCFWSEGGGGNRDGSGIVGWRDWGNFGGLTRSLNFWGPKVEVFFTLKSGYFVWFGGYMVIFWVKWEGGGLVPKLSDPPKLKCVKIRLSLTTAVKKIIDSTFYSCFCMILHI